MDIRDIYSLFSADRFQLASFPPTWEVRTPLLANINARYSNLFTCVVQGIPLSGEQERLDSPNATHQPFANWEQILFLHMQAWQKKGGPYLAFIHRQLRNHPNAILQHLAASELEEPQSVAYYQEFLWGEKTRFSGESISSKIEPQLSYQQNPAVLPDKASEPEALAGYAWSAPRRAYAERVEQEVRKLQEDFLERYARSPSPEWLAEVEIDLLQRMLYKDTPVEGAHHAYGIWNLSGEELRELQRAFKLLMDGRTDELLKQRSKHESPPAHLPLEAESLMEFTRWLRQRRYISRPGPPVHAPPRQLKWLGSIAQLEECFAYGLRHELFHPDTDWEDFWDHFENEYGNPIRWMHFNSLLVYGLDQLIEAGFFPVNYHKHFHVLLAQHFLDRYGAPLKPASLASTRSQSPNPRGHEIIDALILHLGKPYE